MLHYRGSHLIRHGLVGLVLLTCTILIGLQSQVFITWATTTRYQAVFAEAGGLEAGDDVVLSGMKVGTVSGVALENGDAHVVFAIDEKIRLGSATTAQIKTASLLGKRMLTVVSEGGGTLKPLDIIPASRTSSPYSLTDAVGDLTTNVTDMDTRALDESLNLLSLTLDRIAPQVGPTFRGVADLSRSVHARDESLRSLLTATSDVSGILADRSEQVDSLILQSNTLLEVLTARRHDIVTLLGNTSRVADELSNLVDDNEAELGPTLARLNSVLAMLEKNRDNIAEALPGLAKVSLTQGEAVSNGPYYNAFVANLIDGHMIQPFIDQAFGVQPPAVFPIPRPQQPAPEGPR